MTPMSQARSRAGTADHRARARHLLDDRRALRPVQRADEPRARTGGWRAGTVRLGAASRRASDVLDLCAGTGDLTLALARRAVPAEVVGDRLRRRDARRRRAEGRRYDGSTRGHVLGRRRAGPAVRGRELRRRDGRVRRAQPAGPRPPTSARCSACCKPGRPLRDPRVLDAAEPGVPWRGVVPRLPALRRCPRLGGAGGRRSRRLPATSTTPSAQFPDQAQLAAELRAAGFSAVSWRDLTGGIVAVHVAVK